VNSAFFFGSRAQVRGQKLIVGLGNPGEPYRRTRHNVGARAVEALARRSGVALKNDRFLKSFWACASISGQKSCLAFPQTFMNLSGEAVVLFLKKKKISVKDLLVVSDDASLPLGDLRVRAGGSSGGHNGLQSVIERLGTDEFGRLRLGIGSPPAGFRGDLADYVLERFAAAEEMIVKGMLESALEAMETWLTQGTEACMNIFNRRDKQKD